MNWPLHGSYILGVNQPGAEDSPFSRGSLVLRRAEQSARLLVRHYQGAQVHGEALEPSDWESLLRQGDAVALEGERPCLPHAALWRFGATFIGQAEAVVTLRASGAHLAAVPELGDGAHLVDESLAGRLREDWANEALRLSHQAAREGRLPTAQGLAAQAFQVARGLQVDTVALRAALAELLGDTVRSRGLLQMACNSEGQAFFREAQAETQRLCSMLREGPRPPTARTTNQRRPLWGEGRLALARQTRAAS